jgi:DNA-binding SARP family transcriptional activator
MRDMLEISLLGGVAVRGRGTPAAPRAIGLLTFLALNADAPQSRSHLAGTFWPDSTDAQARTNLRRELHQLRNILDDDTCLVAEANTLAWRDVEGYRVDVRVFLGEGAAALDAAERGELEDLVRHGTAAVDAYRGPLLPGWYDDWVLAARETLQQQCLDVCDRVVAAVARAGDPARGLALARRRIQLAPLEEPGYRQLMDLQAASGDRAGAMTTYHRCASVLEQELGMSPSKATVETMEAVIGSHDALIGAPRSARGGAERAAVVRPSLIGRHLELEALMTRWEQVLAGQPGLVLVTGEAGVGKSRLVTEFSMVVARQGGVVASARCFGSSGRIALAPVADWLRSPQLRAAETALEPVWQAEVERLVPRGSPVATSSDASHAKVDAWQRLRFFEGLARGVLVADRPTMLVIDDLQWCDNDTMLWIVFLLGLTTDAPLVVVATARDDELADNTAVLASIRSLRSTGRVTDLTLRPFSSTETADVAGQMLGRPLAADDLSLLQSATGGYPLYVVEAMRNVSPSSGGSAIAADDVSGVLHRRLNNASDQAQQVAGLAGAVGRDFSLELISEASDLDADTVVRAVDELWRRRILRQSGQGYDFSHDLLRDAAYTSVPPARRWLHHRRLAQALELLHAGQLDDAAAQLAHHHARSGRPDRALPFYARAAEVATKVFATAEAIRLLRLSLELIARMPARRERDLLELDVLEAISAPLNALRGYADPELESVLTRSVELAKSLGQTRVQLGSVVGLWASRFVQGDISGSHQVATRALELSAVVPELAGQAHFAMGGACVGMGSLAAAVEHLGLASSLSVGAVSLTVGTRPEVHAQAWAAHARWLLGDATGAEEDCAQSLRRAREVDHPYSLAVALAYASITHQLAGDLIVLDDNLAELTELCARYEIAYYCEWGLVLSGWRSGGAHGIARMRQGLANLSSGHSFARMPYWLSLLAEAHLGHGDQDAARASLDAAQVAAAHHDERWWLPEVLRQSAALQPVTEAHATLQRAVEIAAGQSSLVLLRRCQDDLAALAAPAVRDHRSAVRGTA